MRLINTTTFELKEFGPYPPVYAILSHTWGEEEVTFQDMANLGSAHTKKGFAKIERCCRQALRDGLHWAWVDTCCIDKTSSAELSETINSMFKWYSRALKCYAFLEDVPAVPNDNIFQDERFLPSRWWTRGWTLQELIAPLDVEFYDRDWLFLARKNDCKQLISRDYGIPESILDHAKTLGSICAAERISWASARETSREEDMAYCLLGLMDVNMPLLYGEGGSKALLRLQEQVITTSEDLSLFLWGFDFSSPLTPALAWFSVAASSHPFQSALASCPRDFSLGRIWSDWPRVDRGCFDIGEPPEITSRGLRMPMLIKGVTSRDLHAETSPVYRLLNDYLKKLLEHFPGLMGLLQPGQDRKLVPNIVFLGAYSGQGDLVSGSEVLPCILLLNLGSYASILSGAAESGVLKTSRTYIRFLGFFYKLPPDEVLNGGWENMSCFIKTHQTDADTVRLRLQLFSTAWTHSEYLAQGSDQPWVWRTPSPNITCQAFHFLTDDNWTENRHGIHLHASESCPAAVVLLATRGAAFWHSAYILRRRRPMGQEKLIQGFKRLTSNAQWQDNPRELGPVCEQRLPFGGDKCLVVTLCLEKGSDGLGSSKRVYKVYLAVEDRGPQVPRR